MLILDIKQHLSGLSQTNYLNMPITCLKSTVEKLVGLKQGKNKRDDI